MKKLPKSTKEHRSKAVQIKSAVPHETCDELCNSSSPKYNDSIQAGMKSNVILDKKRSNNLFYPLKRHLNMVQKYYQKVQEVAQKVLCIL